MFVPATDPLSFIQFINYAINHRIRALIRVTVHVTEHITWQRRWQPTVSRRCVIKKKKKKWQLTCVASVFCSSCPLCFLDLVMIIWTLKVHIVMVTLLVYSNNRCLWTFLILFVWWSLNGIVSLFIYLLSIYHKGRNSKKSCACTRYYPKNKKKQKNTNTTKNLSENRGSDMPTLSTYFWSQLPANKICIISIVGVIVYENLLRDSKLYGYARY